MAKIDVISMFFESFELVRKHYHEVMIPIVLLLLMSGTASIGADSIGRVFTSLGRGFATDSFASAAATTSSTVAPQIPTTFLPFVGGALLAIAAAVMTAGLVLVIFHQSLTFYVYGHFYSLLRRKKISTGWEERMKKYAIKSLVLLVFWCVVILVFIALSLLVISLGNLLIQIAAALVVLFLLLSVGFYTLPLWVYYVLDSMPFFASLSKSFCLVKDNAVTFTIFTLILLLLGIGIALASMAACCFSSIVAPLLGVMLSLVSGITVMKMTLALGKK